MSSNMRGTPPTHRRHLLSKAASIDWTGSSSSSSQQRLSTCHTQRVQENHPGEAVHRKPGDLVSLLVLPDSGDNQQNQQEEGSTVVPFDVKGASLENRQEGCGGFSKYGCHGSLPAAQGSEKGFTAKIELKGRSYTSKSALAVNKGVLEISLRSDVPNGGGCLQEGPKGGQIVLPLLPSKVRPDRSTRKQMLRKTLSDNIIACRQNRLDLTVDNLTLEVANDLSSDLDKHGRSKYHQIRCFEKTGGATQQFGGGFSSCPNLVQEGVQQAKSRVQIMRSSERHEGTSSSRISSSNTGPKEWNKDSAHKKLLRVPNIFVTSFTHSSNMTTASTESHHRSTRVMEQMRQESLIESNPGPDVQPMMLTGPQSHYRHSAPELSGTQLASYWERLRDSLRPSLYRSLSDNNKLPPKPKFNNNNDNNPPLPATFSTGKLGTSEVPPVPGVDLHTEALVAAHGGKVSNEPRIAKILSYLFIGNLETSYDERLTCRLGIRSVIDLSNMVPEDVPTVKRSHAPCMCGHDESHHKATLRLGLSGATPGEMSQSFKQINKFIEGARKANKKVLVVCWSGNSVSALAVMQYLMTHASSNLHRAHSMVMRQGNDIELSPAHQVLLQTLEKRLLPQEEQSLCFDQRLVGTQASSRQPTTKQLTREAWTSDRKNNTQT